MNRELDDFHLAGFLYEVYCMEVGGVAFNGDKLPDWNEFSSAPNKKLQADAWIAVARASREIPYAPPPIPSEQEEG